MSRSIQRNLRRRLVAGLLVLAAAVGAGLYLYVRSTLIRQFDAGLSAEADLLSVLVEHTRDNRLEFEFSPVLMPQFAGSSSADFFQIRSADGKPFAASPSLKDKTLAAPAAQPTGRPWNCTLPNGKSGRAILVQFKPRIEVSPGGRTSPGPDPTGPVMTLIVARDRGEIDRPMRVLFTSLLAAAAVLSIGTIALVTTTLRRGLRPLRILAEQAAGIDAERLAFRFPSDRLPAELIPICDRLNALLGRLQQAFDRERRFTSDVAHELRTPIAELRTLAEVTLRSPGGLCLSPESANDALAIARQMERIVTALLALARCQSGKQVIKAARIDLSQMVQELWSLLAADAASRGLRVYCELPDAMELTSDPTLLGSIVSNLLSNAVAYTPAGGRIQLRSQMTDEALSLIVQNDAHALTVEDLAHVFEPFWRKDVARTDNQHSGLGLSLVMAYAELLGMQVGAELPSGNQFRVVLTLPAAAEVNISQSVTV